MKYFIPNWESLSLWSSKLYWGYLCTNIRGYEIVDSCSDENEEGAEESEEGDGPDAHSFVVSGQKNQGGRNEVELNVIRHIPRPVYNKQQNYDK